VIYSGYRRWIMRGLKSFTQSITWLLILTMTCLYGWLIGMGFTATGATAAIDSLHEVSAVGFWFALLFSRWLFVALWAFVIWRIATWLHKSDWLYFKPAQESSGYSSHSETSKDVSGWIILITLFVACLLMLSFFAGDLCIRGGLKDPFFLLTEEENVEQVEELPSGDSSLFFKK